MAVTGTRGKTVLRRWKDMSDQLKCVPPSLSTFIVAWELPKKKYAMMDPLERPAKTPRDHQWGLCMMKKVVSAALVCCLLLSAVPASASSSENQTWADVTAMANSSPRDVGQYEMAVGVTAVPRRERAFGTKLLRSWDTETGDSIVLVPPESC